MIEYTSFKEYIGSATTLLCRIQNIDKAIDALMLKMLDTTDNADLKEYQLDDGQTKIRTVYANTADVQTQIYALERLKTMYQSRLHGRVVRFVNASNFR